jgi:hypothetical protein
VNTVGATTGAGSIFGNIAFSSTGEGGLNGDDERERSVTGVKSQSDSRADRGAYWMLVLRNSFCGCSCCSSS